MDMQYLPDSWGPLTREAYAFRRTMSRSLNNSAGNYRRRWSVWLQSWARFKRRLAKGL